MIAFQNESVLESLVRRVREANAEITRTDDKVRLFQVPLDLIV